MSNISVFFSGSACAGSTTSATSSTATGCGTRGGTGHQARTVSRTRTGSYRSRCASGSAGTQTVSCHRGEDCSRGPAGARPSADRETGACAGRSAGARASTGSETVSRCLREDRARGPTLSGARGRAGACAEAIPGTGRHTRTLQVARLVTHSLSSVLIQR